METSLGCAYWKRITNKRKFDDVHDAGDDNDDYDDNDDGSDDDRR